MFEYKIEVDGQQHVIEFRPSAEIPFAFAIGEDLDGTPFTDDTAQMKAMLAWALSPEDYRLLKLATTDAASKAMEAWQAGGKVTVGESGASSGSSEPTARPSKPTSSTADSG